MCDLQKGIEHLQRTNVKLANIERQIAAQEVAQRVRIKAGIRDRLESAADFDPAAERIQDIIDDIAERLDGDFASIRFGNLRDQSAVGDQQRDPLADRIPVL